MHDKGVVTISEGASVFEDYIRHPSDLDTGRGEVPGSQLPAARTWSTDIWNPVKFASRPYICLMEAACTFCRFRLTFSEDHPHNFRISSSRTPSRKQVWENGKGAQAMKQIIFAGQGSAISAWLMMLMHLGGLYRVLHFMG